MKYTIREKLAALREKLSVRKAGTRLLALLLALVLLQGDLMLSAYSAGGEGESGETSAQTSAPETTVPTTPEQTEAESKLPVDEDTLVITLDGAETTAVSLLPYEKAELKAEGLESDAEYQWQICHPATGTWINIYDATEQCISVSSALVKNMLTKDGTAALRCYAHAENADYVTSFVTVTMAEESVAPVTPASSSAFTTSGGAVTLADEPPEFVTVTINYIQYDFMRDNQDKLIMVDGQPVLAKTGKTAFTSYMATLHGGGELKTTVHFPTIVGYDAYWEDDETPSTEHAFDFGSVTQDLTYQVSYKPALVSYTVRYFFQNIYDDLYVEDSSKKITSKGYTGATPPDSELNPEMTGFTALYHQPDAIAADGSTVFEVYYERNYYLMEFNCNGGYGAETVYVRYGSHISVPDPTRMGYVFGNNDDDGNGWDLISTEQTPTPALGDNVGDTLPATMPPYNSGYKAIWSNIDTVYSVVYWAESKTGTTTYLGSRLVEAMSGSTVHGSNDLTASMNICGQTAHTHGTGCTFICDLSEHAHGVGCICSIPIHTHSAACCTLHDHVANGCLCTLHTEHNEACCDLNPHTHNTGCYTVTNGSLGNAETYSYIINQLNNSTPNANGLVTYGGSRYTKIGGTWYRVNRNNNSINWNSVSVTLSCTQPEHTHGDGNCIYDDPLHNHGDGTCTYSCGIVSNHTHDGVSCDYCDLAEHASHDSSCCSLTAHSHGAQCYSCGLVEHTHTDDCKEDELSFMVFDRADQNVTVKGDGSSVVNVYYKWKIFEIRFVFARSYVNNGNTVYQIADSTGNGNVYGGWNPVNVASLPTVDPKYESKSENYNGYTAHYIAVRAEYGANIESMWPSKAIHDVYDTTNNRYLRRFGSWGAEEGTPYRIDGGTKHANIVGPYPYMSKEMIKPANLNTPITDANGEVYYIAQRMSAWWGDDGTMRDWHGPINAHSYHIYVEAIDGSGDRTYNGKEYDLLTTHYFDCAHNNDTRVDPFDYTGLVCINDTRGADRSNLDKDTDYQKNSSNYRNTTENINDGRYNCPLSDKCTYCNCFYYDRNIHQLSFVNYNSDSQVPDPQQLMYGTSLSNPGTPEDPEGIEPHAYEFQGWYTTPEWYTGTEVNWTSLTMPNGELTLYAKWTPIIRNVIFYSAYSDIAADTNDTTDKVYHFMKADGVPHGTTLGSTYFYTPEWPKDLETAINGGTQAEMYDFVGWFYMDENGKKKFAPDSMEVIRNLVLFAEWQTSIDTTYEVKYVLADDTSKENTPSGTAYSKGTIIADAISAHSSVGKTKTFNAKGGSDLYSDFQTHFFPTVSSHSILMEQSGDQNKFTFEYKYDDIVYYKVRYLDYATRTELRNSKVVKNEDGLSIVTEKFLPIEGYLPQNYYITKALAYDGTVNGEENPDSVIEENIITFYYTKDTEHGLYSVEYYLENPSSDDNSDPANYYQYESIIGSDDNGFEFVAQIRTYEGYTHVPGMNTVITYNTDGTEKNVEKGVQKDKENGDYRPYGIIDYTGLTIKIYYKRNSYPYVIEYREYGSDALLKTVEDGSAKFDTDKTHVAETSFELGGLTYEYYIDNADEAARTKTMTIRVPVEDDPDTYEDETFANKLTFYYKKHEVTVHYVAVCKTPAATGFGGLSFYNERAATASALSGSNATPGSGFEFTGWYTDAECTDPVNPSWRYTPGTAGASDKQKNDGTKLIPGSLNTAVDDVYYYALFEPITTELKITKTVKDELPDGMANNDTFLFHVKGQGKHEYLELTVAVTVNKGTGSVTIANIPLDDYTVTELTGWSWEYALDGTAAQNITLVSTPTNVVAFTNEYANPDWLGGESAVADNNFN